MTAHATTIRISDETRAYVQGEAERSGLSASKVIEAFLAEAAAQRWQIVGQHFTVMPAPEQPCTHIDDRGRPRKCGCK